MATSATSPPVKGVRRKAVPRTRQPAFGNPAHQHVGEAPSPGRVATDRRREVHAVVRARTTIVPPRHPIASVSNDRQGRDARNPSGEITGARIDVHDAGVGHREAVHRGSKPGRVIVPHRVPHRRRSDDEYLRTRRSRRGDDELGIAPVQRDEARTEAPAAPRGERARRQVVPGEREHEIRGLVVMQHALDRGNPVAQRSPPVGPAGEGLAAVGSNALHVGPRLERQRIAEHRDTTPRAARGGQR